MCNLRSGAIKTRETVAGKLERIASIDKINPKEILGGTDCGFETYSGLGNVSYVVAIQKLRSLVAGAELASERSGLAS